MWDGDSHCKVFHCRSLLSRKQGRPFGPRPSSCAQSLNECSHIGTKRCRILVVSGKGCSYTGHPSSSIVMEIIVVIEAEICLPVRIVASPIGCRSAVSSVATFLPITDGQVACPLWVWNAGSRGQFLSFVDACLGEALALVPRAPSSFRIWVHDLIAEPQCSSKHWGY